eukprot:1016849_1
MEPKAYIYYRFNENNNNAPKSSSQPQYTNHKPNVPQKRYQNPYHRNAISLFQDPVMAPLLSLFSNLNLDKLRLEKIDIEQFVHHLTPQLLSQFLNEQGFHLHPSTFASIPAPQLRSMLNDTKLFIFLKRKLAHPAHTYSITHYVHENHFDNESKDEYKGQTSQINNHDSIDLSPCHSEDIDSVSTCSKSDAASPPPLIHVSSALSCSPKSPQTTNIIRNILKGIENVMLYNATSNATILTNDAELSKECLTSTKMKQESGELEFEFEEFAYRIFHLLRRQFDLKSFRYLYKLFGIDLSQRNKGKLAMDIEYATKHFWKSMITNSKSGQLFYRSKDNLFIIKELKYDEWYLFTHSFLFHYFRHIQCNKDSLLAKILGVYRVNETYFMVMKNVHYAPVQTLSMNKVYDLKGSTHNRRATRHKLVLDDNDYSALTVIESTAINGMNGKYDEEEEETIDNLLHTYSPSWYQPTLNEDLCKINVIKSDTLQDAPSPYRFALGGTAFKYNEPSRVAPTETSIHKRKTARFMGNSTQRERMHCNVFASNIEVWKRSKILKDLDWLQDEQIIKIGKIRGSFFLGQLDKDLKFLHRMNVMDYSLLVGMHFRTDGKECSADNDDRWMTGKLFLYENGGMCYDRSEEENDEINMIKHKEEDIPQKDAIYFCGIIDFLQTYTAKKKVETLVKGLAHDWNTISAIDPEAYARRLYSFVQKSVE